MTEQQEFDWSLECRTCDQTHGIESGSDLESVDGWEYVGSMGLESDGVTMFPATCRDCFEKATEGSVQSARERGVVECPNPDHGGHIPDSEPYNECRQSGYLPLTQDDHEAIVTAYHEAREYCCPDCSGVESLNDTIIEHNRVDEYPGYECGCGWTGFQKDLAYRKVGLEDDNE